MEASDLSQLLGSGSDLDGMTEIFQGDLYMEDNDDNEPDDVIILHMDIREPLRTLQNLIEQKIGISLKGYKFWLQDTQELQPFKNLVDQCVKGEGLVQINVQIQTINQRINIVDVLKPTEAALAALAAEEGNIAAEIISDDFNVQFEDSSQDSMMDFDQTGDFKEEVVSTSNTEKPALNWVLDSKFKKEQARLKIPEDPHDWTVPQVKHWLQWAVRQFDLNGITISDWNFTGRELCSLTHEEFRKKLPKDPGNVFWTHLQLLKECKFVSVVHKAAESALSEDTVNSKSPTRASISSLPLRERKIMRKSVQSPRNYSPVHFLDTPQVSVQASTSVASSNSYGVGSGNNGQVQLWQFLLDILTDREHTDIIQWVGQDGEFKLSDPERVARLWGERKNKPAMNYEKLSRALRYYYDGDMISKVSGKRFAYKFDCDLKLLIGYDAAELSQLVNEESFLADRHSLELDDE